VSPEDLFTTVPGIGETLAQRIHRTLDVESLEDLEVAAHDGRLATVPGFGPRRTRAIREELSSMLRRSRWRRVGGVAATGSELSGIPGPAPDVRTLLEVDAEYRRRAEAGDLRTIAPRRFNPQRKSWLPIFHTRRGPWSMTALYSNTALAHRLARTRDWVIIYFERDGLENQCTVVTELRGELAGRRVIRGREAECLTHHASETGQVPPPADRAA
jgi:DNA polymerase (family X)